jgi:hypothetical protein
MYPRASGNFDLDLAKYKSYFLDTNTVRLSPYRVWLSSHICVLRITPIYRLGSKEIVCK